ncbi:hypothetical protein QEN19_001245 [Hanseniaspora menglaensis]
MSAEGTTTTSSHNNVNSGDTVNVRGSNDESKGSVEKLKTNENQKKDIDRLTQLQILIDQLLEQFLLSLTYINNKHKLNNDQENESFNEEEFKQNVEELSNDLIIKCKQILKLIDLLPDSIDDKQEALQIERIKTLSSELEQVELEKLQKIEEKQVLMKKIALLIKDYNKL